MYCRLGGRRLRIRPLEEPVTGGLRGRGKERWSLSGRCCVLFATTRTLR